MGVKELISKIREMKEKRLENLRVMDEGGTNDEYLKSLRRERQVQLEEVEKEQLKKKIAEVKKAKLKQYMYGITRDIKRKELMGKEKTKDILHAGNNLLKCKSKTLNKFKLF